MAPLRMPPRIYVPPPLTAARPAAISSFTTQYLSSLSPLATNPQSAHPSSSISTTHNTPRGFTSTPSSQLGSSSSPPRNRVYNSIRSADDFSSLLSLSTSSNQPLITLWTASWCPSCRFISPLLTQLIEAERAGESASSSSTSSFGSPTSVAFAEVELDSPDIGEVAGRYQITSIPLLLAFSRGEPMIETRVGDVRKLKDAAYLREWIQKEAARGGKGGAGGSLFGSIFK